MNKSLLAESGWSLTARVFWFDVERPKSNYPEADCNVDARYGRVLDLACSGYVLPLFEGGKRWRSLI